MRRAAPAPALLLATVAAAIASGAPRAAHAAEAHADVSGRAEYTDNVFLTPEDATQAHDQIFVVNPAVEGNVDTRGVQASLRYSLNYYHYQDHKSLDRALHDLEAKAALVYWDAVDLDAKETLAPQPISYAAPITDPVNLLQSSRSEAHLGLHHEFGPSTRAMLGYRGAYGTWFKVNDADVTPPSFLEHGPEITAERDIGPLTTVGITYAYRMHTFSTVSAQSGFYQPLDWQGHQAELEIRSAPLEWLGLRARGGGKAITFENKASKSRAIGDLAVIAGGDPGHVDLDVSTDLTQDYLGNPASVSQARLGAEWTPNAPWSARIAGSYGALHLSLPDDQATPPNTLTSDQSYIEAEAGLSYRFARIGEVSIGGMHHESLTKIETVDGNAKIAVNRAFLSLGGKF